MAEAWTMSARFLPGVTDSPMQKACAKNEIVTGLPSCYFNAHFVFMPTNFATSRSRWVLILNRYPARPLCIAFSPRLGASCGSTWLRRPNG